MKKIVILFHMITLLSFGEDDGPIKSQEAKFLQQHVLNLENKINDLEKISLSLGEEDKPLKSQDAKFLQEHISKLKNKTNELENKTNELENKTNELEKKIDRTIVYKYLKKDESEGVVYNIDQIYSNSLKYYDQTINDIKWLFGLMIPFVLVVIGFFKWDSDKKLKEEREEIKVENEELKKDYENKIKDYKNKIKDIEDKFEKDLKKVEFNSRLGLAINKFNNKEKIEELKKIEEEIKKYDDNDELRLYFELGYFIEELGDKIKYYNRVIGLDDKYKEAYNNRGLAKYNSENYGEALKDYDRAIELDDKYKDAYNNRGNVKNNLGNYEGALKDYDKAIKMDSNSGDAYSYYGRGIAKDNLGDSEEAIKDYERAIQQDPNYKDAYNNKAEIHLRNKKNDLALADLSKIMEIESFPNLV